MFSKVFAASTLVACAYAAVPGWHSGDGINPSSGSGDFECTGAMGSTIKLEASLTDSANTICQGDAKDINQALEVALRHGLDNINYPIDCVVGSLVCSGTAPKNVKITLNLKLDKKYTAVELLAKYNLLDGGIKVMDGFVLSELKNAIDEFASGLTTQEITAIVSLINTAFAGVSWSYSDENPAVTTAPVATTTVVGQVVPDAATDAKPLFATVAIAAAATLAAFAL
jgi:hypothetical protein